MTRRRLIAGAALVAAVVVAVGIYAYEKEKEPIEKRGSASEEFVTTEEPKPPPPQKSFQRTRRPPCPSRRSPARWQTPRSPSMFSAVPPWVVKAN